MSSTWWKSKTRQRTTTREKVTTLLCRRTQLFHEFFFKLSCKNQSQKTTQPNSKCILTLEIIGRFGQQPKETHMRDIDPFGSAQLQKLCVFLLFLERLFLLEKRIVSFAASARKFNTWCITRSSKLTKPTVPYMGNTTWYMQGLQRLDHYKSMKNYILSHYMLSHLISILYQICSFI